MQRFSSQERRRATRHRGPSPPYKTLLIRTDPEIRPPGTPRTPGDVVRNRLLGQTTSPRGTGRAQAGDPLQDPGEQLPRDRHFCQLEADVPGVGDHLGPVRLLEVLTGVHLVEQALDDVRARAGEAHQRDGAMPVLKGELEADPERLDQLEARINELTRLKRKYGGTIEAALETLERARLEIAELESLSESLAATDAERWNMLHPEEPPRVPFITKALSSGTGPVIASTDYMKALADGVRPYVPGRYKVLGTDGFGRSDYRRKLRSFFEVDRYHVAVASLKALADDQLLPAERVSEAIKKYGIDPEGPNPAHS